MWHLRHERERDGRPVQPAPISLQLRDFYKMDCGIIGKLGRDERKQAAARGRSLGGSDSFLVREQTTAEGSLMERLLVKIDAAVGERDALRSTLTAAGKQWRQQKTELAVRAKIYAEHECESHKLA